MAAIERVASLPAYINEVFVFAGLMVLTSVLLTQFVSAWFWLFTAFIGLNLLQASITGMCPAAWFFRKLGLKSGCTFE